MLKSIPIVDASPLWHGPAGAVQVAEAIGWACREVGFFYLVGHGVPPELRAETFAAARRFFALPVKVKKAVGIDRSPHNRGYVGLKQEALDPKRGADLKESFQIGLELAADDPEVVEGKPFRGVNLWPDLDGFRDVLLRYYDAMHQLGIGLHRAIAVDLGQEPEYFDSRLDRPMATLRLLHYPSNPRANELGAGEHTDYGNLTLLATDEVAGLEVRTRDGKWIAAPYVENSFVCNVGDCLMRWTNDIYVSTPHRVVSPKDRERYSIPFFLDPNPDAVVDCLPGCAGSGRPARYVPITAADFLKQRLSATYEHLKAG
ncbi:MAG: 2-oxoglutarate and iron-dependent oxygenase domain-containing protein [Geminicoccaceae bacterium]